MRHPIDAVVAVNYCCNARCLMCHIWKAQSDRQLSPSEFNVLPRSLRTVNVSGGEPFLRDDLPDLVRVIRTACPGAKITISTNGLLSDKIERTMKDIVAIDPAIALGVSVDGIGEKHDEVRGVPGAYEKAMDTLTRVRAAGITDLRIAYTACPANVQHFSLVYDLARHLKVQFTCAVAHNSSHYFRTEGNLSLDTEALGAQVVKVVVSELKTLSPKRWARAYFTSGLARYAAGKGRPLPCTAGSSFFFLNPSGDVYPCNVLDVTMGNLRQVGSFDEVWLSKRADLVRGTVAQCKMGCWMICTARSAMRQSLRQVVTWVVGRKVRAHFGLAVLDPP